MKLARRVVLRLATGAAALSAFARTTWAQLYPSRPITIIVPVPPGGVADPIARILADHLTVALGQPVVVENVTGAGGSIGVGRAARATPDGYTISIGNWLSHVGASAVYPVQYEAQGFCRGSVVDQQPDPHHRPQRFSPQRPQGADRLARGEPQHGDGRNCRRR